MLRTSLHGMMLAMSTDKAKNEVFNLTTGNARKLLEMAEILKQHFHNAQIKHTDWDRLTPKRGTLSIEKARTLLGFESQYQLEQGFVEYIDWYKKMGLENEMARSPSLSSDVWRRYAGHTRVAVLGSPGELSRP